MPFCSPYENVQENVVILFLETLLVRVIAILSLLYKKGSSGPGVEPVIYKTDFSWKNLLQIRTPHGRKPPGEPKKKKLLGGFSKSISQTDRQSLF